MQLEINGRKCPHETLMMRLRGLAVFSGAGMINGKARGFKIVGEGRVDVHSS